LQILGVLACTRGYNTRVDTIYRGGTGFLKYPGYIPCIIPGFDWIRRSNHEFFFKKKLFRNYFYFFLGRRTLLDEPDLECDGKLGESGDFF